MKVLGNEGSTEQKFPGMKVPRTKVPEDECSTYGTFVSGNESSWVQKFHESSSAMSGT